MGKSKKNRRENTNGTQQHPTSSAGDLPSGDNNNDAPERSSQVSSDDESPLQLFSEAKRQINEIYDKLDNCVGKSNDLLKNTALDRVVANVDVDRISRLGKSIETIRHVLSRNHMKVAFFGHNSNGKSTVINAILHDNVLPHGYGATTKCLIQIQGTEEPEAHALVQRKNQPEEKESIKNVAQMANALNRNSLEYSTLLKIFWPTSKCSLLKHDVVFVDSPGFNVNANLDEWIDDYCHDADVFVLVSMCELTLSKTEIDFFVKVRNKLSKPNIFILKNRFDIIEMDEPESMDEVRKQHVEVVVDFLQSLDPMLTQDEAKQRMFFVSAKETLRARCPNAAVPNSQKLPGYQKRSEEFREFEKRFEESLSKSAVKTKFEQHCDKGQDIINELTNILKNTGVLVSDACIQKLKELQSFKAHQDRVDREFYSNEAGLKEELNEIKSTIQNVSSVEFDKEIRRLSRTVDEFKTDFSTHPAALQEYKNQLYVYMEEQLGENIKTRIHSVIKKHVNSFDKIVYDLSLLLTNERQQSIGRSLAAQVYVSDDLFNLRMFKPLYTNFHEDLEFRFSFGLMSIIRKFQTSFSRGKSVDESTTMKSDADVLPVFWRVLMNPPQSPTTVTSLALGGVLVRSVGWRVIVITSVVYGALYAYEYLTWTNSAKERAFKAQYVRYATRGLQSCVPSISEHIADSVVQKMNTTFVKLKDEMDSQSVELKTKTSLLRDSLEKLKMCDDLTKELIGENSVLLNELRAFAASFFT